MPVLLVCGDRDRFFAKAVYEQTAELIPDSTVELYEGKDHLGTLLDKRPPRNVLEITQQGTHPAPACAQRDAADEVCLVNGL